MTKTIEAFLKPAESEKISLEKCTGRIICGDVFAIYDVPSYDKSLFDGFALRAADTWDAGAKHPVVLDVIDELPAGSVATKEIVPGTAIRIMTGAPIPKGADTVVALECVEYTEDKLTLSAPVKSDEHILYKGAESSKGDIIIKSGELITTEHIGMLAYQGYAELCVFKKPVAGIITTGSELVEIGDEISEGKIYNSNRYTFAAMLSEDGCEPSYVGMSADSIEGIAELITKGVRSSDMLIITGGICTGDYDLTPRAMRLAGCRMYVEGMDRSKGMNCYIGKLDDVMVCALSGNPRSAVRTYEVVIRPVIQKLRGREEISMSENQNENIATKNTAEFWDSLAKPCSFYERRSEYADEFIKKSGICPGDTVLDMGCGSGTLCLPLADDGHRVFCGDFSEKMLESVNDVIKEENIDLITTTILSWQEDWDKRDIPVCDYAFASRCLFDVDPDDAVEKLSTHAFKKVCITLPVNADMFKNRFARYQVGEQEDRTDYLVAILAAAFRHGYMPEMTYMKGMEGRKGWAFISWDV